MKAARTTNHRQSAKFLCNLNDQGESFPHFWEHTVGSGHATLALRADWQKQISRCHRDLGFSHVRFHGLLCDDMGTLVSENNKLIYSFFNADQIIDFLLSIGMKPFMELSFMPTTLSSGNDSVFHYGGNINPPKDYAAWAALIKKLVKHWVVRYGVEEVAQWFFEIWNEPNLKAFWTGTQANYFKLYEYSAKTIKSVDAALKVGGPATAQNAWVSEFVEFCDNKNVPLDFISTHHYPTDSFGKPGDDTIAQLAASKRSILKKEAGKVARQAQGKPVYYTEWSTSSNPFDELHDKPYAASYITKTVMEARGLVDGYSYWTFSDIFEENYFSSAPFHGGFGLMNIHGIPKPAYRAYELLHNLGDKILEVEGQHPTVDAWVTRETSGPIAITLTNSSLPHHPVKTENVVIKLRNVKKIKSAFIEKIDDENANAFSAWEKMGRPSHLSPKAVNALEVASSLVKHPLEIHARDNHCDFEVVIEPQTTAKITLEVS